MIDITTAIFITMGACVVTYFWGKSQVDVNFIIGDLIDNLKKGGYVTWQNIM